LLAACSLAFGEPRPVLAQHITIDGRFSPAQTLVGPNYTIGANLGKQVGSNPDSSGLPADVGPDFVIDRRRIAGHPPAATRSL
jgi:hypothetical protein